MKFETSGLRGLVTDLQGRASALYTQAFALQLIEIGAAGPGSLVLVGRDFRPSSSDIAAACIGSLKRAGLSPIDCGALPTPALALYGLTHPTSYRPWGGYTSVLNGDRFQVKRLFVTPGKKLSLQKHHHRSEHWICVKGTAEVTIGNEIKTVRENESVYIPQGEVHRLANPGKIMLEMIEVQTGSYLGEDDIIRIVDEFGRG